MTVDDAPVATSRWSIGSENSLLSIASKGSILSICSIGSACSIFSIGSFFGVGLYRIGSGALLHPLRSLTTISHVLQLEEGNPRLGEPLT